MSDALSVSRAWLKKGFIMNYLLGLEALVWFQPSARRSASIRRCVVVFWGGWVLTAASPHFASPFRFYELLWHQDQVIKLINNYATFICCWLIFKIQNTPKISIITHPHHLLQNSTVYIRCKYLHLHLWYLCVLMLWWHSNGRVHKCRNAVIVLYNGSNFSLMPTLIAVNKLHSVLHVQHRADLV